MINKKELVLTLSLCFVAFNLQAGTPALIDKDKPDAQTNWRGFYLGVQGGYGRTKIKWTFPFNQYFTFLTGNKGYTSDPSGSTAGGQLGVNYQIKQVVVGVEAAKSKASMSQSLVGVVEPLFPNDQFTTTINQFTTVTGRFGFAYKNWLPYLKGGFARTRVTTEALSGSPGAGVEGKVTQKNNGWTIGGGVEYNIIPLVILGIEYNHIRLPEKTYATTTSGPTIEPFVLRASKSNFNIISARVSLKLDDLFRRWV